LILFGMSPLMKDGPLALFRRVISGVLVLAACAVLSACGDNDSDAQVLARVNGEEITARQINDELMRTGVKPAQHEAASRQLLELLIDRELITEEAMRNNIHRKPEVVQAIERAKAQIIAQAYIKSVETRIAKPSPSEINDYFQKHQEYFSQRKQYTIQQIVFATSDLGKELRAVIDSARSLDSVATWMDRHRVRYARGQILRSTVDLPELMVAKLKNMKKNQLFIFSDGENSMLNCISGVKDSPVDAKDAAPQIEQYLINNKYSEVVDEKIAQLRSSAKIEYLVASAPSPAGQSE
jgi:peptidyl-prolyl cis-trans isomerase C